MRGVKVTRAGNFTARINVGGDSQHLGTYATKEAAGKAYDVAAIKAGRDVSYLNFPNATAEGASPI